MLCCLRADAPSPVFLAVVAGLIEANVLHNRGAVSKPGTISTVEARKRSNRYVSLLRRAYPGKVASVYQARAIDIIAYELVRDAAAPMNEASIRPPSRVEAAKGREKVRASRLKTS